MRPTLSVLSDELIGKILDEAKRIMAETGMEIRGENMRQRLLDHGLKTDKSGKRILFSPDTVDAAVASAPKSFTLYNRDGQAHAEIGGNNVHFVPASSGLKILDHRSGETRLSNSNDFIEYARLCDGLEHIAYLATAFSTNQDIEPQVSDAWRLYMTLITSKKPVVSGAFSEHGVPRMAEMLQKFRSDRAELIKKPMSIFTITATGNFRYGEDSCQNLLDCTESGIPVEIVPVTLMGLIAPVTLVGATPAIDAGNNFAVPVGLDTDLDGLPRFADDPAVEDTGRGEKAVEAAFRLAQGDPRMEMRKENRAGTNPLKSYRFRGMDL